MNENLGEQHRDPRTPVTDLRVKIADFGLVSLAGDQWLQTQVQQTVARSMALGAGETVVGSATAMGSAEQALLGTYAYMSPEQKRGEAVDHRSDLFAVGLIGYQMLTGEESAGMESPSELVPELDPGWDSWVKHALALRVERRIRSAEAMLGALPVLKSRATLLFADQQTEKPAPVQAKAPASPVAAAEPARVEPVQQTNSPQSTASRSVTSAPAPQMGRPHSILLPGDVSLALVWIEPGEFLMGSPEHKTESGFLGFGAKVLQRGEKGRFDNEGPQTRVRLTKGFWLGKYPVTQDQWQALMGENPSGFKKSGLNAPVESVSWNDAMKFAGRLTELERLAGRLPDGYVYTLPSEAQWEYAVRAGTTTRFYTGNSDSDLDRAGWFNGNSGRSTKPVGQKVSNAWVLYDMHGNVWEWTRTWFGNYPGGSVVDYEGPASGSFRVSRGGSWYSTAQFCRSADRTWDSPDLRSSNLGFRLALSSVQKA